MNPNPGTMPPLHPILFEEAVRRALLEDLGRRGDITTDAIVAAGATATARMVVKTGGRIAGIGVAGGVFHVLDPGLRFEALCGDGADVPAGATIAVVRGSARSILSGERTALNFLAHMSGIATATRQYVEAVSGTKAKILDTRKTVPGLRILDKYAVRIGGGTNHRFGLGNCILIKENHIEAAGGIGEAVSRARQAASHTLKIEVEVKNFQELDEALAAGADIIMLDNMSVPEMREAVRKVNGKVPLEASGNVTLATVRQIAETGVDFISSGALTHSVKAADLSLLVSSPG